MRKSLLLLVVGTAIRLLSFDPSAVLAVEAADLAPLLGREIIGPQLALEEVQAYCEAAVPAMPHCETAQEWQALAEKMRQDVLERVVFRGEAAAWRDAEKRTEWQDEIAGGPGYRIRKLRYEALPGLWIPALLYQPEELDGRVPVMLAVNGHDGLGKAAPYKQIRCINLAKRGMLVLNVEWLGMGQLRSDNFLHYKLNQLDLCGTSGVGPFYLAMQRGLDVLLSHENADAERVAVSGLSGGGWQTIIISALDPRVTLSNPVAGYSSFKTRARNFSDLGDSEQTPVDLAAAADYAHLTAMRAPRPTLLTYNASDDCCFRAAHALPPLLEAATPVFKLFGSESHLRSHVNEDPGTHNFERDNRQALYRMIGDFFYAGSEDFSAEEIPSDDEVRKPEELNVKLPADNADLHSLAVGLMADLPHQAALPNTAEEAAAWQQTARANLAEVLRARLLTVEAEERGGDTAGDISAVYWQLHLDHAWTVPAVELSPPNANGTVILVADEGRACEAVATAAAGHLAAGRRVLAIDPFYFGEAKIASHDFLFALLISAVGDRPLGVQASQIAAVARWSREHRPNEAVSVEAHGERLGLAALCAAALEEHIAAVEVRGGLGSLKEVIERNGSVNQTPELFCFGLLRDFDVVHLAALVAPRPCTYAVASERAKSELAPLAAWYKTLGADFNPLP